MNVEFQRPTRTSSRSDTAKKWLVVIAILAVVFGVIFGGKAYISHRAALAAAHEHFPPPTVSTALAKEATWNPEISTVATVEAVAGTEITAQIAGDVTKIAFESGAEVKQGALLVQIDNSTELAQLHADQAKLQLAIANAARAQRLFEEKFTSLADLQTRHADVGTALAAVEGDRALLAKLRITAPFEGRVGIRNVSLGQYVSPGTPIVDLESYQPIYVNFSLPQSDLSDLKVGDPVHFTTEVYPDHTFAGRVTSLGSRINPATRNIDLQATFANASSRLKPGMFGSATLSVGEPLRGISVPNTAISYSTFGDTIYVVKDGDGHAKIVQPVIVHVLRERGSMTLVTDGLKDGDTVVVAGQNKLRAGTAVAISNVIPR